ncbi:MAG: hypothetical protein Q9176_005981 [Flavoplaca citrina]
MFRLPIAIGITAISIYSAQKSYIAITNLQKYEERSERAAKHSETAAHELHKTRTTQGSSAGAIALSLLSSIAITLSVAFDSSTPTAWEHMLPPVNILAIGASFMHNQNFWKAKAKIPFVGGFNEGIEKNKEIRQLLFVLGIAWGALSAIGWISNSPPSHPSIVPPLWDVQLSTIRMAHPWVTHSPGQISTWEFYAIHGHLPRHAATRAWRQAHEEVLFHARGGSVDQPLGTRVRHWMGSDEATGDIVDLVIHPGEELTWRMVGEAWRAANALICMGGRGFQFLVMVPGVEGEVAVGEMRARVDTDVDVKDVEKRQVGRRPLRLPKPDVVRLAGANRYVVISFLVIWSKKKKKKKKGRFID